MLEHFLVSQLFAFLLIFCRMGSGVMLLPGIGEGYVSFRLRLLLALFISLALTPLLLDKMPTLPGSPLAVMVLVVAEVLVGVFLGGLCRIFMSAMHTAGLIAASQSSLASATLFDITQASQGTSLSNFLGFSALIVLFSLNMHHLMIRAMADSYTLFAPGVMPPLGDFVEFASRSLSDAFNLAVRLSAPMVVISLIIYFAAGILGRLMPAMQVFFVIAPAQILISFFIMMTTLSAFMLVFAQFFETKLNLFLAP